MKWYLAAVIILASAFYVQAQSMRQTISDVERRAFLAGIVTAWNPGTDRWEQDDQIDRTDPDWEEAFQTWIRAGRP